MKKKTILRQKAISYERSQVEPETSKLLNDELKEIK